MKEVIIVGGGASGLFASIIIKEKVKDLANVTIVERLEKVGKKILATGNGRCNLTNVFVNEKKYNDPIFAKQILKRFNVNDTLSYFDKIGLITKQLDEGRIYPHSEIASSVLDVLRNEAKRLGVIEKCNFDVRRITKSKDLFIIENTRGVRLEADYVIIATGGKSTPVLGSNGSGYNLLKRFRLKITDTVPGLTGVKVDDSLIKGLTGIRLKAKVTLYNKKTKQQLWSENGEVQFKEDGLSGLVIMQMQSYILRRIQAKEGNNYLFSLDLLPNLSHEEIVELLERRIKRAGNFENDSLFIGIFHRMIGLQLLRRARIDLAGYTSDLNNRDIGRLATEIKEFLFEYKGHYDFSRAQVTIGGLELDEVLPETLEARRILGLYVCGEVLNIDGECGGFNLQWAWSSGYLAGTSLAKRIIDTSE